MGKSFMQSSGVHLTLFAGNFFPEILKFAFFEMELAKYFYRWILPMIKSLGL